MDKTLVTDEMVIAAAVKKTVLTDMLTYCQNLSDIYSKKAFAEPSHVKVSELERAQGVTEVMWEIMRILDADAHGERP